MLHDIFLVLFAALSLEEGSLSLKKKENQKREKKNGIYNLSKNCLKTQSLSLYFAIHSVI